MEALPHGAVVIGAGLMGLALAERLSEIGTTPWLAARRPATELTGQVGKSRPIDVADIADLSAEIPVFLAIPLSAFETIPQAVLEERLVIDVANYWPRLDANSRFADSPRETSALTQAMFPTAHVIKTINHLAYFDVSFDARPPGGYRRGQCVAGNDADARLAAARIVDALGFDPVDAGPLVNGRMFGPGTEIFGGGWRTADQLARILRRRTGYPAAPFALR